MGIKNRFCLFCLMAAFNFSHAAEKDSLLPAWQVEGFWAALNDENPQVIARIGQVYWAEIDENVQVIAGTQQAVKTRELFLALGERAKSLIPRLTELLRDPDERVRVEVAQALGALGAKEHAPELAALLRDPNPLVFYEAIRALGAIGAKEHAPELVKLLQHSNLHIVAAAARALGAMGPAAKDQIPELVKLLHHPDLSIVAAAAQGLGAMGPAAKDQIPELVKLLQLSILADYAAQGLGAMGPVAKDQIPKTIKPLPYFQTAVVVAAVRALGAMGPAAKDQIPELVKLLQLPDLNIVVAATQALGAMGPAAKDQIPELVKLLQHSNLPIVAAAVQALGAMGPAAKDQIPELVKLLHIYPHPSLVAALMNVQGEEPLNLRIILSILSIVYDNSSRVGEVRFLAHFLGGGEPHTEIITAWLADPMTRPTAPIGQNHDLAVKTLKVFAQAWPFSKPFPKLRRDLETQIATVAQNGQWKTDDLPLLKTHAANLEAVGSTHAAAVQQVIASVEATDYSRTIAKVALIHALFWLTLIAVYPRSRIVQALFFWNPWVRRFIGLGYVGFALTWIPFLRAKLFAPFKPSLMADAALDSFDETAYFPNSAVREKTSGRQQPLRDAIPAIRGQIVLEGESGIGKTMFLRLLVKRARRVVVYLPAKKCVGGVLEAIQAKLHGPAQDPAFLRNLIYSGALDICIDGLNEVSADARAKITGFVESYFKGNILMSTQPLEWTPPGTAKTYILEPLAESQIETFLLTHKDKLPNDAQLTGEDYEKTCRDYLSATLDPQQPPETLAAMRQLLSNPMDLTVVAAMLARGENPDLFRLQQQQYRIMAKDYQRTQLHEFPLHKFAEAVYQMRLKDEDTLPVGEFADELQCLERHKMAVSRPLDEGGKSRTEWHFRHDKIVDFFIVQAFLGPANDKPEKHLGDARFRGVYLQLARLLPLDDARALERRLIDHAADTQDHTVSDPFIQLLRTRPTENEGESH